MPMGIGPGLSVTRGGSVTGFSPASLFAAGEPGVWYDPSDFSTMFQDSAGTTPVTAVEQPVGLLLDKSQGLVLGPELRSDGTVAIIGVATAATYNTSTGAGTVTRVDSVNQSYVSLPVTAGLSYYLDIEAAGTLLVRDGGPGGSFLYAVSPGQRVQMRVRSNVSPLVIAGSAAATVAFTIYSFKLLPGNHATQATSASRPVLSARVNLLLATATLATQSVTTAVATYTLAFTGAGTVTLSGTATGTYSAGTNSFVCTAGTLTLTVVGSVTTADLRVTNDGVGLPAYQAVVTSTNYDTTGFPYYLRFDGSDDSMATNTITPGIDKAQVFAGVRKLSDTGFGAIVELSAELAANNGSFLVRGPESGANYFVGSKGTSTVLRTLITYTAPITNIIAMVSNISGPLIQTRINGLTVDTSTASQGAGNYLAYPLYIGRRGGTSLPFNGRIYSLITRFGANLDATTITDTETWVNGKTKAY